MNGRTIVAVILVILLAVGGYYLWQHHHEEQADGGEVHWVNGKPSPEEEARFKKENAGETADGNSEHKTMTARQDDATGFQDGAQTPVAPATAPAATGTTAVAPAPASPAAATPAPAAPTPPTTNYASIAPAQTYSPAPVGMPTSDSQSANAPNGMRFGGSGTYQWYRQGNLTWRIDTRQRTQLHHLRDHGRVAETDRL